MWTNIGRSLRLRETLSLTSSEVTQSMPQTGVMVLSRRGFLRQFTSGACAAAAGAFCLDVSAAARQRTYTNPVYAGSMPDPFVLRHGGVYYAFGTTGGERKRDGRIYTVLRSTNLVDWRELGGALEAPTPDPAYQYWAPEVAYDGGTFYLYYSVGGKEEEKFEICVATSRRRSEEHTSELPSRQYLVCRLLL